MALTRVRLGATAALATAGVFLVVRALVGIDLPALPRLPFMPGGGGTGTAVAAEKASDNLSQGARSAERPTPVSFAAPDRTPRTGRPRVRRSPFPTVSLVEEATASPEPPPVPTPTPVEPPKIEPPPPPEPPKVEPPPLPKVEPPPLPTLEPPPLPTFEPQPVPTFEPPTFETPDFPVVPELPTP